MATEKLKINHETQKIKPEPIHTLKTIKRAVNPDSSDHRHNTKTREEDEHSVKMETLTLFGKGRETLTCVYKVNEINSKILFS
jgi:hypothetical protein